MNNGIKAILCIITIILMMIGEKGTPIKLGKFDFIVYGGMFVLLLMLTGFFN